VSAGLRNILRINRSVGHGQAMHIDVAVREQIVA